MNPDLGKQISPTSQAVDAGARAGGSATVDLRAAGMVPAHLLDGDEVVLLAIKPSLWFIPFSSFRWLAAMGLIIAAAPYLARSVPAVEGQGRLIIQAAAVLAAVRLLAAAMQWVSRLYVLTNRRLMRIRGVFNVDIFECPLTRIQNTFLRFGWHERLVGVGTIGFATAGTASTEAYWHNVAHPLEVHERIRRAIQRAMQMHGGGAGV